MVKLQYIIASLLLLCGISFGQSLPPQAFSVTNTLTVTGGDTGYNIKGSGINAVVLIWSSESGTNSSCAMQVETSADNVTYAQPTGGASQTCTGNGATTLPVLPANFIRVNLTTLTGAGNTIRYKLIGYAGPNDPCGNAAITQSSSVISQAASTQEIVASVANTFVHVCGGSVQVSGPTSPTLLFKTGTNGGAPCNTSSANLSGTYTPGASGVDHIPLIQGVSNFTGISGGEICVTGGGTTPTLGGFINWIRAPY